MDGTIIEKELLPTEGFSVVETFYDKRFKRVCEAYL